MTVTITNTGSVLFVWSDGLQPLLALGSPSIRRASHVEPTADCRWTADMGPSGGPVLGPFATHLEALHAEAEWLGDLTRL